MGVRERLANESLRVLGLSVSIGTGWSRSSVILRDSQSADDSRYPI